MNRTENMMRLRQQGFSYGRIASLYGISRQRVHQIISGYSKNNHRLQRKNGTYWRLYNAVLDRDEHKCQKCGDDGKLIVHHIDGNDNNNVLNNLITLCNKCHLSLHRPPKTKIYLCMDCGKPLQDKNRKRCWDCFSKSHAKPERNKKIMELIDKGWRYVAIANMFKMKVSAVSMVIHRARQKEKVLVEK